MAPAAETSFQQRCSDLYPFKGSGVSRGFVRVQAVSQLLVLWDSSLRVVLQDSTPSQAARCNNPLSMWAHCDKAHKSPFYNVSPRQSLSRSHFHSPQKRHALCGRLQNYSALNQHTVALSPPDTWTLSAVQWRGHESDLRWRTGRTGARKTHNLSELSAQHEGIRLGLEHHKVTTTIC